MGMAEAKTPDKVEDTIQIRRVQRQTAVIEIAGTSPLIVHRWSEKAKEMMLAAQQGRKAPREVKNPEQDFEASRYKFADGSGDGFPTTGFKKATVSGGGRMFGKSVKMTELRQSMFFISDGLCTDGAQLIRIDAPPPTIREDMVRLTGNKADIRYRAMYPEWTATLRIRFTPHLLSLESLVALVDAGGSNGVGEWRPEKDGDFGTYEVIGEGVER
jgi:hypothetical protein